MQNDQKQSQGYAGDQGEKFDDWIRSAGPEAVIQATKAGLARVSQLDRTHRDRFFSEVHQEPVIGRLLDEMKAPA